MLTASYSIGNFYFLYSRRAIVALAVILQRILVCTVLA